MHVEKIGHWDEVKKLLAGNLGAKLAAALRQANIRNALLLVREIKRGIRSPLQISDASQPMPPRRIPSPTRGCIHCI